MVNKGNHPLSWPYFRFVNYYNLPSLIQVSPRHAGHVNSGAGWKWDASGDWRCGGWEDCVGLVGPCGFVGP